MTTTGIERIARQASSQPTTTFTSLMHHYSVENLRTCYLSLDATKAPGVDIETAPLLPFICSGCCLGSLTCSTVAQDSQHFFNLVVFEFKRVLFTDCIDGLFGLFNFVFNLYPYESESLRMQGVI